MLGEGYSSPEKHFHVKKVLVGKKIAQREMPMTMNERGGSSHTPLYGISREFAKTSRSTCRNICRVRAEYVLSTRKMGTRLWDLFPWGGVIIE